MAEKNNPFKKRSIQHGGLIESTWINQQPRSRQQSFALIHLHAISKNRLLPDVEKFHTCQWSNGETWGFEISECPRKYIAGKRTTMVNAWDVMIMHPRDPAENEEKNKSIHFMPEKKEGLRYYVILDRNIYVEQMFRIGELNTVKLNDPSLLTEKLETLYTLVASGKALPEKISVLLFECLTMIYCASLLPPEKMAGLPMHQLRQVMSYPQNFPTLRSLVDFFGVSRPTLTALFKKNTGKSPMEFVIESKLNNSVWHLKYTESSINEIALLHGYKDAAYFCNAFKKQFGLSPSEFRKKDPEKSFVQRLFPGLFLFFIWIPFSTKGSFFPVPADTA